MVHNNFSNGLRCYPVNGFVLAFHRKARARRPKPAQREDHDRVGHPFEQRRPLEFPQGDGDDLHGGVVHGHRQLVGGHAVGPGHHMDRSTMIGTPLRADRPLASKSDDCNSRKVSVKLR